MLLEDGIDLSIIGIEAGSLASTLYEMGLHQLRFICVTEVGE